MSNLWEQARGKATENLQKIAKNPTRVNDEVAYLAELAIQSLPQAEKIIRGESASNLTLLVPEQLIAIDVLMTVATLPESQIPSPEIKLALQAARQALEARAKALLTTREVTPEVSEEYAEFLKDEHLLKTPLPQEVDLGLGTHQKAGG